MRRESKNSWDTTNKAVSDFSKVIELRPDDMEAYYNRALTHSNSFNHWHKEIRTDSKLSGFSPENTYKFVEALVDFQKVIESDSPWSALAIAGRANLFYRHANWKVAIMEYKKAIERKEEIIKIVGEDGFAGLYAPMGRTYMSLGEMENAFSAYKNFMDLCPNPLAAFHELGTGVGMGYAVHVAQQVKKYGEAAEWYDRRIAISEKPKPGDYSGKGFCYYKLKEYDKAIASYNKCLDLLAGGAVSGYGSPEGDARRYLGMIYKEKGDIGKAEKEFRNAIRVYSKKKKKEGRERVRYQERGLCYFELGEYDKAISDFKKILESKKSRSDVKIKANKNLGVTYLRMGSKEKAKECLQKTLKLVEAEGEAKKYRYKEIIQETEKLLKEF